MKPESGPSQEEEPKIVLRTSDPEDRPRAMAVQCSMLLRSRPSGTPRYS